MITTGEDFKEESFSVFKQVRKGWRGGTIRSMFENIDW